MLPILPFDFLFPAAAICLSVFLILAVFLIGRRILIMRRGSRLDHDTRMTEAWLSFSLDQGEVCPNLAKWLQNNQIGKARALIQAVEQMEAQGISPGLLHRFLIDHQVLDFFQKAIGESPDKWLRAESAWALGRLGYLEGIPVLAQAIQDPEWEVSYAAAQSLAGIDHEDSLNILVREIRTNSVHDNIRLSALTEAMTCNVVPTLLEMIKQADPEKQLWAVRLIGQKKIFELIEEIRPLIDSPVPTIRGACAECLAALQLKLTDHWLKPLLIDDHWYVQVHVVKALGRMRATWAIGSLCIFLSSMHWWVRHMASEALIEIGKADSQEVCQEVEAVIMNSDDTFAREAAIWVLERLDWIDGLLVRASKKDSTARLCLLRFVEAGGLSHLENALHSAPFHTLPLVLDLLGSHGDDATYGRIRSALYRMPEDLQKMALVQLARLRSQG